MIIDSINNFDRYAFLGENFAKAAAFLKARNGDVSGLPDGRTDIDGDSVYISLMKNHLDKVIPSWEAHDLYADVQVIVTGEEKMGWASQITGITEQHPDRDLYFCTAEKDSYVTVHTGEFVIFLPGEAHAPALCPGAPTDCRKAVIKVHCEGKLGSLPRG